ncbi:MAG: phage tail tape measure protein [Pyramidobacter sp.]|nr:phage tail tape measure protein [Pyramidobacter sp.]
MAKMYEVGLKLSAAIDPKLRGAFASAQESMRALGNGMKAMQDRLGNMDAWRKLSGSVKDTKQQFGLAKQEMERLRAQMAGVEKPTKTMAHAFAAAKDRVFELGDRLRSQRTELAEMSAAMEKAGISTRNFGAEQQRLQEQMAKMTALRERMAANASAIQANDARKAALKQKMLGPFAGFISPGMIGAAGVVQTVRRSAEYEHTLNQVQAVKMFTDEQRKMLDQRFRYLGRTTEFTENDAARLGLNFAQSGLNEKEIIEASSATLDMATAHNISLDSASSMIADQIKTWGLATKDTAYVASILTKGAHSANMNVEQLIGALRYSASTAKNVGMSPEQLAALVGLASDRGIKDTMAGTGINMLLSRLMNPTKQVAGALGRLGLDDRVDFRDSKGNMRDPFEILGMIAKRLEGKGTGVVGEIVGNIGGKQGARILFPVIEALRTGELQTRVENIKKAPSENYIDKAAKKMREGLTGAMNELTSAWQGFTHMLFTEDASNGLAKTIRAIAAELNKLTDWLEKNQNIVTFVTTLATQFVALKMALGGAELIGRQVYGGWLLMEKVGLNLKAAYVMATSGVDALTAAQKKSSIVFKMWNFIANANPIGLVVTAVAALAAGAYYLYNHWEPFRKWWNGIWSAAKEKAAAVWEWLKSVPEKVLARWQAVKDWFAGLVPADLGEKVAGAFNNGITAVKEWFAKIKEWIVEIPGQFVEMIKSLPSRMGEAFEEFGRYIKGKLKEFFTFNFSFGDVGKKIGAGVSAWSKGAADPSGDFDMNVPGSAAGRKTNGPMLSLIGEGAAPEYVIPTESRYRDRALALWQQAGKDLGVPMYAKGEQLGKKRPSMGVFAASPYNISPDSFGTPLEEAMKLAYENISEKTTMMMKKLSEAWNSIKNDLILDVANMTAFTFTFRDILNENLASWQQLNTIPGLETVHLASALAAMGLITNQRYDMLSKINSAPNENSSSKYNLQFTYAPVINVHENFADVESKIRKVLEDDFPRFMQKVKSALIPDGRTSFNEAPMFGR